MATEPGRTFGYAPQLDGLRAIAVAAVAYSHWLPDWQAGVPFGAGVHLFFVLSGFLITRILLDVRAAPNPRAAIGRFYVRRALRLFPAFYVILAVAIAADVPLVAQTWPWHATYLSNVFIAGQTTWQGYVSHFWSLAVEEQFYLVWPWLVVWLPEQWLGPGLLATILAGPGARALAATLGLREPFWALVPGGSADSLGLGALLAWWRWRDRPAAPRPAWRALVVGAAATWVALAIVEARGWALPPVAAIWRQVVQGLVFAAIVEGAVHGFAGWPGRLLQSRPVVAIGRISYGIYLVHAFAPLVLDSVWRAATGDGIATWAAPVRALVAWMTSVALAALLWSAVEAPAHRLKARF